MNPTGRTFLGKAMLNVVQLHMSKLPARPSMPLLRSRNGSPLPLYMAMVFPLRNVVAFVVVLGTSIIGM